MNCIMMPHGLNIIERKEYPSVQLTNNRKNVLVIALLTHSTREMEA